MIRFDEKVKAELQNAFGSERVATWNIQSSGDNELKVDAGDALLTFYVDDREATLTTTITFVNEDEFTKERLFLNSISGVTACFGFYLEELKSYKDKLAKDVRVLSIIIELVDSKKLGPRDLLYYSLGYNDGRNVGYNKAHRIS